MSESIDGKTKVFGHAIDIATGEVLPLQIDPATGELKVTATLSGTISVAIDKDNDSIQIWGTDGATNVQILTDAAGRTITNVADVIPGVGATNLGKAEDAVHGSGDVGVMALAVRNDALGPLASDGDYIPLMTNAAGELVVTVSGGGGGGTSAIDNSAFTVSTDAVTPAGALFDDVAPDLVGEGDVGLVRMSQRREAYTQLRDAEGNERGMKVTAAGQGEVAVTAALPAGGNNIGDVDVLSVIPGVGATNLGKAEDAVHAPGDVGVMALAVRNDAEVALAGDGDYIPFMMDADGKLLVKQAPSTITMASPGVVTVTTASISVLAANASRKFASIVNDGGQSIYLAFGTAAISGSGTLLTGNGGVYVIDESNLTLQEVFAIRVAGSAGVTIQEGT